MTERYFIITISVAAFIILKKRTETSIISPLAGYHEILITNVKMKKSLVFVLCKHLILNL